MSVHKLIYPSFQGNSDDFFFSFGATAPILALAYLRETLRFTSIYWILDSQQDSLGGWLAHRKASTCTQTQKNAHTQHT
jgi:hypothetical protein